MNKLLSWFMVLVNPVVVATMVPVPAVRYGGLSWLGVLVGISVYLITWFLVWKVKFNMGRALEIEG